MIERVADLLSDPRLHLDADDIADALWLAIQIEAIAPDQGISEQPAPADDDDTTDPELPPQPPDTQTDTKTTSQQEKESGNLYPSPGQQQGDDPDDMRGVPFRTPAASALPAAREIAKALRPLMRRYPSRTQTIFDEQATVQKIADERIAWIGGRRSRVSGLWHIQLQPARERWFDVELVADVGASMVLWRQSIAEFHHLLLRHGAFRRVRAWSLNTDSEEGSPVLHPGLGDTATRQPPRSRQELLAPGGRRLILVVTDCVSPGWHAGSVTDLLSFWGKHHPIALVQVLPERLWSGSALRAASAIQMQSPGPDVANERLTYSFQSPMDRLLLRRRPPAQQVSRLPVPILTLDGDQVADWASLVIGTGTTPTSGFLLTSTPDASMPIPDEDEQAANDLSPEQLVDDFREYASPEAFRLAQFLAAAPLSLPVIRLVQRTMMPKARQGHIAEVFLSGLLRRRTPAEAAVHPEYVWYDFLAGVREVLRQGLSLYEDALVMERVTEYVREHYGTPQDFQALLFDPDAVDGVALHSDLLPFAEVVAGLQERVGVQNRTRRQPQQNEQQTQLVRLLNDATQHLPIEERLEVARALADLGDPRYPVRLEEWQQETARRNEQFGKPDGYWCYVQPGTYQIGGWKKGKESANHDLSTFWIARYPITVAQYAAFIDDGGYKNKGYWTPEGWKWRQHRSRTQPYRWDNAPYNSPNQAVIGVSWYECMAFCSWLTAQLADTLPVGYAVQLPTEAQWETAAAFDEQMQRRTYPWGDKPEPTLEHAIFADDQGNRLGAPAPVGVCPAGAGACGALDLGGQVWEWCRSSHKAYPAGANEEQPDFKRDNGDVPLRGASWRSDRTSVRCAARIRNGPNIRNDGNFGLRVLLSPRVSSHSR